MVAARDDEAFATFVAARSGPLLATAYALTRDRQLAEDLLQTALARCYVAWPRIRADDPEAYARRALIGAQRSSWRRRLPFSVRRADIRDERRPLLDSVASLSRPQRTVLVFRYHEDWADAEIAELADCTVGSVKRRANRGLRRLEAHATVRDRPRHRSPRHRAAS